MKKQKVLILIGPTASGKSALAVELAKRFNGEVISADSRQVYKGLDIGTGKITKREMQGVPHHLLDVASPKRIFSAQDFIDHATATIEDIAARGKFPIIAGGTGFYIDVLTGRIVLTEAKPDLNFRKQFKDATAEELYALLKKKDPKRARSMATTSERNNKVRLIRALEIASQKDQQPSTTYPPKTQRSVLGKKCEYLWIGIAPDMAELDDKIGLRLLARMKRGMLQEARDLHTRGLSYKRMTELGLEYRSLAALLQGRLTRDEFHEELFGAIRRYARKQIGYWKRNKEIHWLKSPNFSEAEKVVSSWINRYPPLMKKNSLNHHPS